MIAESKAKSANAPVLLPAHDDVPARVLMPLRHNGRLSGYLSYSEPDADESTLTEKSSLLRHASERLGTLIALHNIDRQHQGDVLQRLVADLLDPLPRGEKRRSRVAYHQGTDQQSRAIFRDASEITRRVARPTDSQGTSGC